MSMSSPSAWVDVLADYLESEELPRARPHRYRYFDPFDHEPTAIRIEQLPRALGGRRRKVEASYRLLARLQKLYTYLLRVFGAMTRKAVLRVGVPMFLEPKLLAKTWRSPSSRRSSRCSKSLTTRS